MVGEHHVEFLDTYGEYLLTALARGPCSGGPKARPPSNNFARVEVRREKYERVNVPAACIARAVESEEPAGLGCAAFEYSDELCELRSQFGSRCTGPVLSSAQRGTKLATWVRRRGDFYLGEAVGALGTVMSPRCRASSTGSRRARVAAQSLGQSSRWRSRGQ